MSVAGYFQPGKPARWLPLWLVIASSCAFPERTYDKRLPALVATGASQRASAGRVGASFRITDYGADGRDENDDTGAIQAAIDIAMGLPGGEVYIPAGIYYIGDQEPVDAVSLRLAGARNFVLRGAGVDKTVLVLRSPGDAHMIALSKSEEVAIHDLTLDGRRVGRKGTHGIRVADSAGVHLSALRIHSTAHYGIGLQEGRLQRILIERVLIDDTGGDGIDFKNTKGANEALVLRDIHVSRPGQSADRQTGVDVRGPAELWNVVVTGVPSGGTGIRFREDGPATGPGGHHSRLSGFRVEGDAGSTGVAIAADNVAIDSGEIIGTDTGVVILGNAARVAGVTVRNARYAFRIAAEAGSARLVSCAGGSSRAGLWLEGTDALVQASKFTGNLTCGVCVRPSAVGAQLRSNAFIDNGQAVDDQGLATRVSPP